MSDYIYNESGLVMVALDQFDCESEYMVCPFCGEDNTDEFQKYLRHVTCTRCERPFSVKVVFQTFPSMSWHSTEYDPDVKHEYRKKVKE